MENRKAVTVAQLSFIRYSMIVLSLLISLLGLTTCCLAGVVKQYAYLSNREIRCETYVPDADPGRVRDESLLGKMYGNTATEVSKKLKVMYWMRHFFGKKYPLMVTTVNQVHRKLQKISDRLERLVRQHPDYLPYLDHPGGTFNWRYVENSNRRSPHSYGMAIDLNADYADYWIWETGVKENSIDQDDHVNYKNHLPCDIVSIFESEGFIWGGKWKHYDTMHFEYRPEMIHDNS